MAGVILSSVLSAHDLTTETPLQFEVNVAPQRHEKSRLGLMVVGAVSPAIAQIKKDLEFSNQFVIDIKEHCHEPQTTTDITALASTYPLVIFVHEHNDNTIDWHIYETTSALRVAGKKYHKRGTLERGWAHNIADMLWPLLTGQDGFFSTKIAYCREVPGKRGKKYKHIDIADYDGNYAEPFVRTPTINVAPRFNHDKENPLLFFSESTNENIRLKVANMNRRCKTASDFDGVNMLPAFSEDGSKVVYCASHGDGHCQLYYYDKDGLVSLTNNEGNNISPTLSDDATKIYFCSDQNGKPQIYCHNRVTGLQTLITNGQEACFSPAYCSKKNMLAYVKMIKGIMQICTYNELTADHMQLTFDKENKDECSWSPCGNYILFCAEKRSKGRIAMINVTSKEQRYITAANTVCSFPTWSPLYAHYPVIS